MKKKITITSYDYSTIYTYTGSEDELKTDEWFEYFTVYFKGYSVTYKKKVNIT